MNNICKRRRVISINGIRKGIIILWCIFKGWMSMERIKLHIWKNNMYYRNEIEHEI